MTCLFQHQKVRACNSQEEAIHDYVILTIIVNGVYENIENEMNLYCKHQQNEFMLNLGFVFQPPVLVTLQSENYTEV